MSTSYTVGAWPRAKPARPGGLAMLGMLAGAAALALTMLSFVAGGARVDAAAGEVGEIVAQYKHLRPADFERDLFPIATALAGSDVTGGPVVCGIVVSGIAAGPGGRPVLAWQRSHGSCAGTRLTQPDAVLPSGTAVAVELRTAWPRMGMREGSYSIAYATPARLPELASR